MKLKKEKKLIDKIGANMMDRSNYEIGALILCGILLFALTCKLHVLLDAPFLSATSGILLSGCSGLIGIMLHLYSGNILFNRFYKDKERIMKKGWSTETVNNLLSKDHELGNTLRISSFFANTAGAIGLAISLPNFASTAGMKIMAFGAPGFILGSLAFYAVGHPVAHWRKFKNTKYLKPVMKCHDRKRESSLFDENKVLEYSSKGQDIDPDTCLRFFYCWGILPGAAITSLGALAACYSNRYAFPLVGATTTAGICYLYKKSRDSNNLALQGETNFQIIQNMENQASILNSDFKVTISEEDLEIAIPKGKKSNTIEL